MRAVAFAPLCKPPQCLCKLSIHANQHQEITDALHDTAVGLALETEGNVYQNVCLKACSRPALSPAQPSANVHPVHDAGTGEIQASQCFAQAAAGHKT